MKIISHRGYWTDASEKNTQTAFTRSFAMGFGTETDFREHDGELVIAHDLPNANSLSARDFFDIFNRHDRTLPLAINIKSDGLQGLLKSALTKNEVEHYFLFDMSVPDAVVSIRHGLRVYTRHSDMEPEPAFYGQAAGVWMDAFLDDNWLSLDVATAHLRAGKHVCLVSPELHGRPHARFWERLRAHPVLRESHLILCTDLPEVATAFFKR